MSPWDPIRWIWFEPLLAFCSCAHFVNIPAYNYSQRSFDTFIDRKWFLRDWLLSFSNRYSCISTCGRVWECVGVCGSERKNRQENDKNRVLTRDTMWKGVSHTMNHQFLMMVFLMWTCNCESTALANQWHFIVPYSLPEKRTQRQIQGTIIDAIASFKIICLKFFI